MPARSECKQIRLVEIKPQLGRIWVRLKKKNVAKRLLEFKEEWEKYGREKIILLQKQQCTLCNLIYFHWGKRVDSDVQKPEMESRVLRAALLH